jgi:hypothetical protein
MRFPHPGGFGAFSTVFTDIVAGLAFIICFVIIVGLLVVLVRFLLVATRAAELYIAKNSGAATPASTGTSTAAPAAAAPSTAPTKLAPVTAPTPRTRATRTPPPTS